MLSMSRRLGSPLFRAWLPAGPDGVSCRSLFAANEAEVVLHVQKGTSTCSPVGAMPGSCRLKSTIKPCFTPNTTSLSRYGPSDGKRWVTIDL